MNSKTPYSGVLAVNKPAGVTSHDVIVSLRKILSQKSIGHTGTLDPLATGLMLICLGKVTKLSRFISGHDKAYLAEIALGCTSTTFDAEGVDQTTKLPIPELDQNKLESLLTKFTGTIKQQVPAMSAIRIDGKRLYERARKGETVDAPFREVEISRLSLVSYDEGTLKIETTVSSGTYIRSLAHDIGQGIGCGAYLSSLVRTSVGSIELASALKPNDIEELHTAEKLTDRLIPLDKLLDFGSILVTDNFSSLIRQGRTLRNEDIKELQGSFKAGDHVLMKDLSGSVIAVGKACRNSASFRDGSTGELFSFERVLV